MRPQCPHVMVSASVCPPETVGSTIRAWPPGRRTDARYTRPYSVWLIVTETATAVAVGVAQPNPLFWVAG